MEKVKTELQRMEKVESSLGSQNQLTGVLVW